MTSKYGVFSQAEWQAELEQQLEAAGKKKGAAANEKPGFKSGTLPRSGKLNDATFSSFTSTNVCAPYEDSHSSDKGKASKTKKGKSDSKAEPVSQGPFKPSSPMKKSVAPQAGDFYGTLSKTAHTMAPAAPQIKKGDIKPQPRGIYTTVPKAGSYGTKGVTLSEHKGAGGVAGEYQYFAEPMALTASRAKGAAGEPKAAAGAPFRPVLAPNREFAHYEFLANPTGGDDPASSKASGSGKEKKAELAAFKPARSHGRPLPVVPYMADPMQSHKKPLSDKEKGNAWHPAASSKTDCTRSIVRMNL